MLQKQPQLKVIISDFPGAQLQTPRDTSKGHGRSLERSHVAWNLCGCLYIHFETNLGFTRNEQIGCSDAFQGNTNGATYPHNVTSHVNTPRNVSGKIVTKPVEVQKCPKNSQN